MAIDYKPAVSSPIAIDPANQAVQGRIVSKTLSLMMFTTNENAVWAAGENLRNLSYPAAEIEFLANRQVFRLEPGDLFRFSYSSYGLSEMVCRVTSIREEDLEKETIRITAVEERTGSTGAISQYEDPTGHRINYPPYDQDPLEVVGAIEAPWVLGGEVLAVIPLAGRLGGGEVGYQLYLSADGGASYGSIRNVAVFQPCGTLVAAYSADTNRIDDGAGFQVDFSTDDVDAISTVTRTYLFTGNHLALLGSEIIAFQTITPDDDVDGRYTLTGVVRGMFDTEPADHDADEAFYFLGLSYFREVENAQFLLGVTRHFKMVPYNAKQTGDVSEAEAVSLTLAGRAFKPYMPRGLQCNGQGGYGTYGIDCVLTWSPRLRSGAGAGLRAETQTDASPTWEGCFEIQVWAGGSLIRTTEAIDAATWTYTKAMNETDNGALGQDLTFKILNYIDDGPVRYESAQLSVSVKYEPYNLVVSDGGDRLVDADGYNLAWRDR